MYHLFHNKLGLSKQSAGFWTVMAGILLGTLAGGAVGECAAAVFDFRDLILDIGAAGAMAGFLISYIRILNV